MPPWVVAENTVFGAVAGGLIAGMILVARRAARWLGRRVARALSTRRAPDAAPGTSSES